MRLVKPNWVTHDASPIFSVDIHPDGKRFATGGSGGDSGRVVIWNMEPVLNEEAEANSNIPQMLCQLDHHLACVNCVRWNSSGLLASGGDDKLIMIWKFCPGVSGTTLFGSKTGVEVWRCSTTLRAHRGDILDIAWDPSNQWLASASIDNTIIVWDVPNSTIIVCLRGHTGLVKGVTWDPIGKYLASQSDDKSLRIWRTSDWRQETIITEPFEDCGGTTHVLRLSWSPDGLYLVSAHAMNGGGPTAQIIERDGWKLDNDFVGHRKAVTCVRFNGKIFEKLSSQDEGNQIKYSIAAIGSRDRSLSVWSTRLKRPVLVISEVFVSSVLDISWSPCGMRLCACSKDGTVVFIEFTEKELGKPLDAVQVINLQERLYGKLNKDDIAFIETPEILKFKKSSEPTTETQKVEVPQKPANNCIKITNSTTNSFNAATNKQIETKTSDGKRRITPLFIPTPTDTGSGPSQSQVPNIPAPAASTAFSSSYTSSIIIERRDEVVHPNISSSTNNDETEKSGVFDKLKRMEGTPKSGIPPPSKTNQIPVERSGNALLLPSLKPNRNMCQQYRHFSITCVTNDSLSHLQMWYGADEQPTWNHYLGYCPVAIAASPLITAIACEDGSIHTFHTKKGARAMPPLIPPAPIARLHVAGSMVMVISCYADVRVWEIKSSCRLIVSTSAAHLITPNISLMKCELDNGQPQLIFTNARAYMYHKEMGTWLLLGDSNDPVWRWHRINALDSTGMKGRIPVGPLARLQEGLNRFAGNVLPFFKIPKGAQCIAAYMEHQVLASQALASSEEYNHWILALINFLSTHEGNELQLRNILDELLGPCHSTAQYSKWDSMIVGNKKHTILEEALPIIAANVKYQRLYVEYNEKLEQLKKIL